MSAKTALERLQQAVDERTVSESAAENIRRWLTEDCYSAYRAQVEEHIRLGKWQVLDDVFWQVIPFGTGGRRGRMYPIGTNAINDQTMGESAQGLAEYARDHAVTRPLSCAVAYDTRHRSAEFARLCAEVMAAAGFRVFFLDGYRSTPELSFAVRWNKCACGLMITASHNPPSDNAVKAYWSHGGQLLPPHDQGVIERVMAVRQIDRVPFDQAVADGRIVFCQDEVDQAYVQAVVAYSRPGPRDLRILYSPLHGVGTTAVCPVLAAAGFDQVEVFPPHAAPDGDFPNVPDHVANPENPAVFDAMVQHAKKTGAGLVLATDPDGDRLGCAVPKSIEAGAPWITLTGNQIGAILVEYLLAKARAEGKLTPDHYVVKTMVTSELIGRIAESYGVETIGDLLVGFKWIGGVMEDRGADHFVLGAEESYGFLAGDYARDKDGAIAAMLLAEAAAEAKSRGHTLAQKLDDLFRQHGCFQERTISVALPGSAGMELMKGLMAEFRSRPPAQLGEMAVAKLRDYLSNTIRSVRPSGKTARNQAEAPPPVGRIDEASCQPLIGPNGDVVFLDLAKPGNAVAVRPSGTEPKVKFYLFACEPPDSSNSVDAAKQLLHGRLDTMERDLRAYVQAFLPKQS